MEVTNYTLKLKFLNPILGSRPGSPSPASDFMTEKFMEENPELAAEAIPAEVANLPEELQRGTSMFYRTRAGRLPCFLSYQVKGCIKYSGEVFNGEWTDMKQLRNKLQQIVFISPREIPIIHPEVATYERKDGEVVMPTLQRPLIAMDNKGVKRTALSCSEVIPEGASVECSLRVIKTPKTNLDEDRLRFLLDYSAMSGMGQWRNSGCYGQFEYELIRL